MPRVKKIKSNQELIALLGENAKLTDQVQEKANEIRYGVDSDFESNKLKQKPITDALSDLLQFDIEEDDKTNPGKKIKRKAKLGDILQNSRTELADILNNSAREITDKLTCQFVDPKTGDLHTYSLTQLFAPVTDASGNVIFNPTTGKPKTLADLLEENNIAVNVLGTQALPFAPTPTSSLPSSPTPYSSSVTPLPVGPPQLSTSGSKSLPRPSSLPVGSGSSSASKGKGPAQPVQPAQPAQPALPPPLTQAPPSPIKNAIQKGTNLVSQAIQTLSPSKTKGYQPVSRTDLDAALASKPGPSTGFDPLADVKQNTSLADEYKDMLTRNSFDSSFKKFKEVYLQTGSGSLIDARQLSDNPPAIGFYTPSANSKFDKAKFIDSENHPQGNNLTVTPGLFNLIFSPAIETSSGPKPTDDDIAAYVGVLRTLGLAHQESGKMVLTKEAKTDVTLKWNAYVKDYSHRSKGLRGFGLGYESPDDEEPVKKVYQKKEKRVPQNYLNQDGTFGKLHISRKDLKDNYLTIHQGGELVMKQKISDILKDLIQEKRLTKEHGDGIGSEEAQLYRNLVDMAGVRLSPNSIRKRIYETPSSKITDSETLRKRLGLLLSAREAGNNSKLIEGEIKYIIGTLRGHGKITDDELATIHGKGIKIFVNDSDEKLKDQLMDLMKRRSRSKNQKNEMMVILDELLRRGKISKEQHHEIYSRYIPT